MTVHREGDPSRHRLEFWSLDHLVPHSKKTLGPCLVLPYDSSTASVSAMGFHLVTEVALAQGIGAGARPKALDVYKIEGSASAVAVIPVDTANRKNLPLSWVNQGTRINVNLKKLLTVHPFEVPRGSSAQIPITKEEFADKGTCLVIHFDRAEYVPVEEGRRKSKSKGAQPQAGSANGQAQAAAAKSPAAAGQPQAETAPAHQAQTAPSEANQAGVQTAPGGQTPS